MEDKDKELYDEKLRSVNKALDDHENRLTTTEDKCQNMDKTIGIILEKINSAFEKLSELPSVLKDINLNMSNMGKNMSNMEKILQSNTFEINTLKQTVENQGKSIKDIDNKSKLDFLEWLKQNWLGAATAVVLVIYIGKDTIFK
jgi:chromosome segregation ATPase